MQQRILAALSVLSLSFGVVPAAGQQVADPSRPPCYAFWLDGDVYTNCGGDRERITRFADVEDFAVDPNGKKMALIRHKAKVQARTWLPSIDGYYSSHSTLQVISLGGRGQEACTPLTWPMVVYASCGTVVGVTKNPELMEPAPLLDLLAGSRLAITPYSAFSCSSDRRTVVGFTDWHSQSRAGLGIGVPPQRSVPGTQGGGEIRYDLSPGGKYVAYLYGGDRPGDDRHVLCVVSTADDKATCIDDHEGFFGGGISVADTGEVLWGTLVEGNCYYRGSYRVSTKPLAGYNPDITCLAIMYWRPGAGEAQPVESLGRYPQWITPQTASTLIAWAARNRSAR